jgi:predicted Zn finger-like uncharacterized protein
LIQRQEKVNATKYFVVFILNEVKNLYMEQITIECPNCKKKYILPSEKLPKHDSIKLNCKNCGTSFSFSPSRADNNIFREDSTVIGQNFTGGEDLLLPEFPKDLEITLTYKEKGVEIKRHIEKYLTIIGRTEGDIIINDALISRKHACIEVKGPTMIVLRDLVSKNGTFHNGMRVSSIHLQSGDVIKVGNTEILFSSNIKFL